MLQLSIMHRVALVSLIPTPHAPFDTLLLFREVQPLSIELVSLDRSKPTHSASIAADRAIYAPAASQHSQMFPSPEREVNP